jgi:hypothetical protein
MSYFVKSYKTEKHQPWLWVFIDVSDIMLGYVGLAAVAVTGWTYFMRLRGVQLVVIRVDIL